MIDALVISLIINFINPADPTYKSIYPSGFKECDSWVFNAPPAIKNPILRLPLAILDNEANEIPSGMYEVTLSEDKNYILLIESKNIKTKLMINKINILNKKHKIPIAEFKPIGRNTYTIIYRLEDAEFISNVMSKLNF